MEALMWAVIAVLGVCLLVVSVCGLFVGIFALISDEQLQRCRRCGRYGLAARGRLHADACPPALAGRHQHAWSAWSPMPHLHHH